LHAARKIGIRVCPVNNVKVYVHQYDTIDEQQQNGADEHDHGVEEKAKKIKRVTKDSDWMFLQDNFKPVELNAFAGFTNVQKFELLLAHFSTEKYVKI
jgi:hypothetical protein